MGEPRVYRGTFCTGHTPMVGATAIQYSENTMHEFMEEYKSAHDLKEKKGPGLGHTYDVRAQPKRAAPPLPMAGTPMALRGTGCKPERTPTTSSRAVGSWWTDPIFDGPAEEVASGGKGKPPGSKGKTTTSDIGAYWHDDALDEKDEYMDRLRAENGCKRVLPVEMNSSFALEALPTQHRLL